MTDINVKDLNEWYSYLLGYFEDKKIPVFIHGSTLLGFVRNKMLLNRFRLDKELNFGIRSTDLTLDMLWQMEKDFPYFFSTGERLKNALLYFGPEPIIRYHAMNQTMFEMKAGCGLIATFWKGKTKWIEYMGGDLCLTWPRFQLDRMGTIMAGNRSTTTPFDYHEWLRHYFGEDYMEEQLNWHWSSNSHNLESFKNLQEEGEI